MSEVWGRIPTRLRWAVGIVAIGIIDWIIGKGLDWLAPQLSGKSAMIVGAISAALNSIEPYWFAILAAGAALPWVWDKSSVFIGRLRGPRDADWATRNLRQVRDQAFVNATVKLDGNNFINCRFTNVTFRWDGGQFAFSGEMAGGTNFETKNETARRTVALLKGLHLIGGERGTQFADSWRDLPVEYFHAIDRQR